MNGTRKPGGRQPRLASARVASRACAHPRASCQLSAWTSRSTRASTVRRDRATEDTSRPVASLLEGPSRVRAPSAAAAGPGLRCAGTAAACTLLDGDAAVATGALASVDLSVPGAVGFDEAVVASRGYPGFGEHLFSRCFACGPDRAAGDGLRIFPGPVAGRGVVAAPWVPDASLTGGRREVRPEFLWAALDCPSGWAAIPRHRTAKRPGRACRPARAVRSSRGSAASSSAGRSRAARAGSASRPRRSSATTARRAPWRGRPGSRSRGTDGPAATADGSVPAGSVGFNPWRRRTLSAILTRRRPSPRCGGRSFCAGTPWTPGCGRSLSRAALDRVMGLRAFREARGRSPTRRSGASSKPGRSSMACWSAAGR